MIVADDRTTHPEDELRFDEPMSRHTSWRVGGSADQFFRPRSISSLQTFLAELPEDSAPIWIGLGSNLLVRDGGIRGTVICLTGMPRDFELLGGGRVRAGAGLPSASFARRAARAGLGPAAFFAGIPGTIGGALAMNAGAFGTETWDRVIAVETVDRQGTLHTRDPEEFAIGYRTVSGINGHCFVAAQFALEEADGNEVSDIRRLLDRRSDTQPVGPPSAGSVFRNPADTHAAALIESAGLKGRRVGGAVVSTKHANFIINEGSATAADIETLIREVADAVLRHSGVALATEVVIVGDRPEDLA